MTDLIAIQKIAGWEKLKTLVLDSVSSPIPELMTSAVGFKSQLEVTRPINRIMGPIRI